MIIKSNDFEESLFEFDMRSLYIEQELISETLKERYKIIQGINESEDGIANKISQIISKIFDSISDLLEKAIMNLRKTFQGLNFKKAKDKIEQIRKSTNDPKEVEFDLLIPKVKLLKAPLVDELNPEIIVGLRINGNQWEMDEKHRGMIPDKRTSNVKIGCKAYGQSLAINAIGCNHRNYQIDDFMKDDSLFKKCIQETEKISINKQNCQNQKGLIEQQLETVEKFMGHDFNKCIDKLSKLKTDSRKIAIKSKTMNFMNTDPLSVSGALGRPDKNLKNIFINAANCYQSTIRYTVQYLFQSTAFHIQCLNKNVSNFSNALL